MKTTSKVINKLAIAGSVISISTLTLLPATSVALGTQGATTTTTTPKAAATTKTSPFCTNLPTEMSNTTSKLTSLIGTADQYWSSQNQKWEAIWQKVDQTVAADRQKADTERSADFTKLEAKAKTPSQQQAVQSYIAAINKAVATRRASYDSARQTFRTGVMSDISAKYSSLTGQFNSFESSVDSAFAVAQSSCTSNPNDGPSIRTTMQASLKAARESFQNERKSDNTVTTQVQQLAVTRDTAFNAADQAFQASANTAAQTLKQAFGSSSGSI